MEKVFKPISQLKNWEKNPRNINGKDFERLKNQLELLGQHSPLLVTPDEEVFAVLGGNMRLKAYQELGVETIWVVVVEFFQKEDGLWYAHIDGVESKKRFPTKLDAMMEFSLSHNDRAGYYDTDMLANLMPEFNIDWGEYAVDLDEPITLKAYIDAVAPEPNIEEDEVPEVDSQNPPVSQLGEIYQLGRHRLMCGDSTKIEDVERLMDGQKADIVFTDPPYGYSYQSNHQEKYEMLQNDDVILDFLPLAYGVTVENAPFYIFCGWQTVSEWIEQIEQSSLKLKNMIIWKKNNWSMGDLEGAYAGQYEIILFAHKGRVELLGDRDRDIWEYDRVAPENHPTTKPVGLAVKAITKHSGQNVLDLFGGSGSTLMACEENNKTCFVMELDPRYCDVIRKRYAKSIGEGFDPNKHLKVTVSNLETN